MSWSLTNLPDAAKNKPANQQEAFVTSANNALARGLTEEEAIFAGIGAMRIVAKKNATVNKVNYSAKEVVKRPSHIPDPVLIKALQQQEAQEILKAEMEKIVSVPSYLGKSLPQGQQRNVIAANFDSKDRFVILFDTGEQLISRSMDIKQYVEQYVSVSTGSKDIVPGAMVYKGAITDSATAPAGFEVGYVYVWNTASATLTWVGQTFNPDNKVQQGDQIIYRGTNTWDIYQADLNPSSETEAGYIAVATQSEANAGTNDTKAITPLKLQGKLNQGLYVKQYFVTSNVTALTPLIVSHNLNLVDRDAFTINTMLDNSQVSVDIDSVDANSLTITSLVNLTNLKITVQGAVSA